LAPGKEKICRRFDVFAESLPEFWALWAWRWVIDWNLLVRKVFTGATLIPCVFSSMHLKRGGWLLHAWCLVKHFTTDGTEGIALQDYLECMYHTLPRPIGREPPFIVRDVLKCAVSEVKLDTLANAAHYKCVFVTFCDMCMGIAHYKDARATREAIETCETPTDSEYRGRRQDIISFLYAGISIS
jgi:hypothetical protein